MFAGMKKELAAIESRFAENLAQASQLAELFEDAGFGELEFGVMVPHDEIHFKDFGAGLAGAQRYADWLFTQWSGNAGGALQPSWDPIEAFAALRGALGLARGAISMGRSAVAFGKNVRDLSRLLSRISDDLLKELDDAAKRFCVETHHNLPQAPRFRKYFDRAGLNIEDYTEPMTRGRHRLKPDGVHTGPNNWNKQWDKFFKMYPEATREEILAELNRIRRSFGMGPWQGGR